MVVELIQGSRAHNPAADEFYSEALPRPVAGSCIIMLGQEEILILKVCDKKKNEKEKNDGVIKSPLSLT